MTIEIANNALSNCTKIEDVVDLINDEYASDSTAETIAAAYAIQGAAEAGYGYGEDELAAQLEAISDAGAKFESASALEIATDHTSLIHGREFILGLNQTEMAKVMGVSRGTWLKWERKEDGRSITAAPARFFEHLLELKRDGLFEKYFGKYLK